MASTRGRLVTCFQAMLFKLSWVLASGWSVRLMDAFSFFLPHLSLAFFYPRPCCSICTSLQCLSPSDIDHDFESTPSVCSSELVAASNEKRGRATLRSQSQVATVWERGTAHWHCGRFPTCAGGRLIVLRARSCNHEIGIRGELCRQVEIRRNLCGRGSRHQ